jgi:hypothetical protein
MTTRGIAALALAATLLTAPMAGAHVPGTDHSTPGHEASLALIATASSLVYLPAKCLVAGVGLLTGGLVGTLTGGDTRAAYAIWVPTAGGDYVIRPAHIDGTRPLAFFGSTYSDQPSRYRAGGSVIYDSLYDYEYETATPER